ncbi:MAG: def1 [Rickettsiaceae bacterium]|jgi:peptide deformylase|nr:def1 [Rickettsiaceae bacterium]
MTILPVITFPDSLLKQKSLAVEKVDDNLRKFMDDMLQTMYSERGVGLAAVQVGVLKRILVIDVEYELEECSGHHHHDHNHISNQSPLFLVNPEIISSSKKTSTYREGCLSFPDLRADVERPCAVTVKYLDYNGKEQVLEADGLLATCVQHEIDHLNGVTFVDHLSQLKREMVLKKFKKNNR